MKNKIVVVVALTVVVILAAVFLLDRNKKGADSIEIGCLSPLTGENANYGRYVKQGVDFAVTELNASNYLGKPLQVIFEDDQMSPKVGVSAIQKLVSADKVPVIIGPFGSSVVLACAPTANQSKVVIISASATADNIADAGDFVFRIAPPNSKQGRDIADFCVTKLKSKTAATIFQNNDYGVTLRDAFQKRFAELGGSVASTEGVDDGASDMRAQLTKIKGVAPDVIFFPLHYKEAALMLKQAKELGIQAKFISADGAMTADLLSIAGNAAEGTYYSTLALGYGVADDEIQKFETAFKAANNGQGADVYAAYYYEVTKIIAQAIKEGGYDSAKIRDYLYAMTGDKAYHGITGTTAFDAKGEVNKSFYIYVAQNGKYVLVK